MPDDRTHERRLAAMLRARAAADIELAARLDAGDASAADVALSLIGAAESTQVAQAMNGETSHRGIIDGVDLWILEALAAIAVCATQAEISATIIATGARLTDGRRISDRTLSTR